MNRDDTEQVTTRRPQRVAALPTGNLDRTDPGQTRNLRGYVVGLDVQVIPRLVVDGLNRSHVPGNSIMQADKLRLPLRRRSPHPERGGPERRGVIHLVPPENGAMIESYDGSPGFSVSLANCTPQRMQS